MLGQRTPRRSTAEKLSDCINYITSSGGFHSFGQFLSALLDDPPHADQVVIQTASRFLDEEHLRPFLNKVAGHRLMKGRGNILGVVPSYGFHPSDPQQGGVSGV